jgi:hypothetical protein
MSRIDDTINFLWAVVVVMAFCMGLWLGGTITERKMEAKYELFLGSGDLQAGAEPGLPEMPGGRRDKTE